jgi:hypothetical protein
MTIVTQLREDNNTSLPSTIPFDPTKRTAGKFIYALKCPVQSKIFYIGQTVHPRRRLGEHIAHAERSLPRPVSKWVSWLRSQNLEPEMLLLEHSADPDEAESRWITTMLKAGYPLTNLVRPRGEIRWATDEDLEGVIADAGSAA